MSLRAGWRDMLRGRTALLALLVAGALATVGAVIGASSAPAITAVSLSSEPLYARGFRAKPTLTLALSVEFPTVGAAFVNGADASNDPNYADTTEYVGYYDPNGCYAYDNTNKYFTRTGAASNHACDGTKFSGNFMNWAQTSAIDILRYGLTGGDRIVDNSTTTVLQRAVIPTGFYNSSNFPSKQLASTYAAGALPSALRGSYNGTIYIANCLNRIFFGTERTGNCDTPGNNGNLGIGSLPTGYTLVNGNLPGDYSTTACAVEGGTCTFSGSRYVAYGVGGKFAIKAFTGSAPCNNGTPGFGVDPNYGFQKFCYLNNNTISSATALTTDGYFFARVQVCDADDATSRSRLCSRYPSGNYKPIGRLQEYSDRIRVAVFGYLRDDTLARYGGVLRAPMKYVGPKTFDADFKLQSGANPKREWDESTGVFVTNPESASEGISGAVNYLNQFGRTGATPGVYKTFDPVTELYYEALRYIQGLDPTPDATSGLTTDMKDGFPVYTSWTDPHPVVTGLSTTDANSYSCVKNNILTIGDVNTHADKSLPGNTLTSSNDFARSARPDYNEPNFYDWTRVVGAFESGATQSYIDGKGVSRSTTNPSTVNSGNANLQDKVPGCCNNNRYYMAGAAYWANTHDIRPTGLANYASSKARPGMRARTFMIDVNEYGQQSNEAQFKQNQFYLAAKYGGFSSDKNKLDNGNPFVGIDGVTKDDTTWARSVPTSKAADGLVAKNYFQGNNATELLAALDDIFASVVREAGSIAGAAVSTTRLTTSAGVFQGSFDPSDWSGDLARYVVSVDGSGNVNVGNEDSADTKFASKLLDALPNTDSRKIFVGRTTANLSGTAMPFVWNNLDTDLQNYLRTPPGATASTALDGADVGAKRVAYLRGDRSEESTGLFRRRGSRLGDIINSGAAYSGAPREVFGDADYAAFKTANASRNKAVFVGANDGMLHAFDADTLNELFAYIPSFVVPKLSELTGTAYVHRSYVDGTPVVGDAKVGSTWKTVLVSGAGGGGQGVFALDVSNPGSFAASNVLWEFTDRDDPSMGNVIGRPRIYKMRTSAPGASVTYGYFAVVPAGVNNYVDDGNYSSTGKAAIFVLDLSKAPTTPWTLNSNYYKIEVPSSVAASANGIIGLSATAGSAGEVANLYAGDLQGNLWKFDFTKQGTANWNAGSLAAFGAGTPQPLYIAKDASGNLQPITVEPAVAFGPGGSYIVLFGTGKFLELSDLNTPYRTQSFYAVLDNRSSQVPGRSYLKQVSAASNTLTTSAFAWGTPTSANDTATRAGWYFDFPNSSLGERQISGVTLISGKVVFGSVEPATNGCGDGSGRVYIADLAAGSGSYTTSAVGIQGEPLIFKLGDDILTVGDPTGAAKRRTKWQILQQGSAGVKPLDTATTDSAVERMSWRQIFNYQQVKNKP